MVNSHTAESNEVVMVGVINRSLSTNLYRFGGIGSCYDPFGSSHVWDFKSLQWDLSVEAAIVCAKPSVCADVSLI